MTKTVIYGLGNNFIFSYYELSQYYDIVAVSDVSEMKWGESFYNHIAKPIGAIADDAYDYVIITPANSMGIKDGLLLQGVKSEKVITLQEAFDRIPQDEWVKAKKVSFKSDSKLKYAFILYGGMGDLIVAKSWINCLIKKYKLSVDIINLFFLETNIDEGRYIFSDIVEADKCHSIYDLQKLDQIDKYSAIFRFCIIPEVLKISDGIENICDELSIYVRRLFDENIKNYNRGLFTSANYYKTLLRYFIRKKGTVYHTAFDVFDEFGTKTNDTVSLPCNINEQDYLSQVGLLGKKYLTINTGLNVEYANKKNTREWSFEKWNQLSNEIKEQYPDILVVQVGLKIKEDDDIFADVHLNGWTSLEQIAIVLKNAIVHMDYDGGLVHVNHSVGGKSIVLMGPSSGEKHAYPENKYISSNECNACEWTTPDWLSRCPKGYKCPKCMEAIDVEKVMSKITPLL